jgi:hypothetical protein
VPVEASNETERGPLTAACEELLAPPVPADMLVPLPSSRRTEPTASTHVLGSGGGGKPLQRIRSTRNPSLSHICTKS